MVTLEQIKLLESKIVRAIDVVNRLNEENIRLKKRNGELEELAERLKDEKSRVEAGIVSALDRLNQFEDAIERSLSGMKPAAGSAPAARPEPADSAQFSQTVSSPPAGQPPDVSVLSAYTVAEDGTEEAEDVEELDEDEAGTGEAGEAELDIF